MVPIRKGALEVFRWEYVVFSPMIKNTCPNAGTPSAGAAAEVAEVVAGLSSTPRLTASVSAKPIRLRTRHPRPSRDGASEREALHEVTDPGAVVPGRGRRPGWLAAGSVATAGWFHDTCPSRCAPSRQRRRVRAPAPGEPGRWPARPAPAGQHGRRPV